MPGSPGRIVPITPTATSTAAASQSSAVESTRGASTTLGAMSRDSSAGSWSVARMAALGALHAGLEARGELEPLLATLAPDPVYEFHPIRLRMRGDALVRRFYEQFCARFLSLRESYALVAEWVTEQSVAQEYDIALRVDGGVERFRVLGILYAEGDSKVARSEPQAAKSIRSGGERVYASERFIRLMTGELFSELEPIE